MIDANFKATDFPNITGEARIAAQSLYNFYYDLAIHLSPPFNQDKAKLNHLMKLENQFLPEARQMGLNDAQMEKIRKLAFSRLVDTVNGMMSVLRNQEEA